jgi:hypothetical protein
MMLQVVLPLPIDQPEPILDATLVQHRTLRMFATGAT